MVLRAAKDLKPYASKVSQLSLPVRKKHAGGERGGEREKERERRREKKKREKERGGREVLLSG